STIDEAEAAQRESDEEDERVDDPASEGGAPRAEPARIGLTRAPEALEVTLSGRPGGSRSLASVPALARQLAARTWQLVRFPSRVLLTSAPPVVLWAPSASAKPYQVGLGSAHEVRVPLDPRHALIVARRAPAGEIVRDLSERQARALNRTVAEAAAEWIY